VSTQTIEEIINKAEGDIRQAVNMMEFVAKRYEKEQVKGEREDEEQEEKREEKEEGGRREKEGEEGEEERKKTKRRRKMSAKESREKEKEMEREQAEEEMKILKDISGKDDFLSLFRCIGRIVHNKREYTEKNKRITAKKDGVFLSFRFSPFVLPSLLPFFSFVSLFLAYALFFFFPSYSLLFVQLHFFLPFFVFFCLLSCFRTRHRRTRPILPPAIKALPRKRFNQHAYFLAAGT